MKPRTLAVISFCLAITFLASLSAAFAADEPAREFNGPYSGRHLNRVAFPIGGIGAGMYCLEGTGAISHMSVRNTMEFFNEPRMFAALCVINKDGGENVARVVEGPIPGWKYFGGPATGNGLGRASYGLPRFRQAEFLVRFPFATIELSDKSMPLSARIVGWSPFTPGDPDPSSLPVGALEYTFKNTSEKTRKAVFSFNAENFFGHGEGSIGAIDNGFVLYDAKGDKRDGKGAFAIFVDGYKTIVDHCWFRGGWFDAMTVTWDNVQKGKMLDNPPVSGGARGASLFVPITLKPGEEKTIRLLTCWYVPETNLKVGKPVRTGPAFSGEPSKGTAAGQQKVSGFLGKGLINTFDPGGDGGTGSLTSPEFTVDKKNLHFLVGGGNHAKRTCVNLLVDGKTVASARGNETEQLGWATFDLAKLQGKKAKIQILDKESGGWGHILADEFILSDEPIDKLKTGEGNKIAADPARAVVLHGFEGKDYGDWTVDHLVKKACCPSGTSCPIKKPQKKIPATHSPWYAGKFGSVVEVARHWVSNYNNLKKRSEVFRDAFYDTTLPPEVVEAVAANLTIIKSPTMLRQQDGRLWCWEGCCDDRGCCAGSCTHVWNYAQAICHLFPSLERSLRQTEYNESQDDAGRQAFRANLPISTGGISFGASDGQLGGIMKAYREWRISGDRQWLVGFWPKIKTSLDYMIRTWDPRHSGLLEEDHHNTYDINYYGPDGHCGSFYLGALAAAVRMGREAGDDVSLYEELLAKGKKRMAKDLYNGEYFIQIVQKTGLDHIFKPIDPAAQSAAYCETARLINQQGPKYQY
ncbi:MAG: GH116 family glycosyl-hydrolase, partial [Planctomycetota bacterium]|nr:GH116 family glycosyl-hydrolase [Planctomycetota bacterium]